LADGLPASISRVSMSLAVKVAGQVGAPGGDNGASQRPWLVDDVRVGLAAEGRATT
jgi:hypothetical protein